MCILYFLLALIYLLDNSKGLLALILIDNLQCGLRAETHTKIENII